MWLRTRCLLVSRSTHVSPLFFPKPALVDRCSVAWENDFTDPIYSTLPCQCAKQGSQIAALLARTEDGTFFVSTGLSRRTRTLLKERAKAVLSLFFTFFRAERVQYFQASVGNNRQYIRTTKCRENNRHIVHTEVGTRSHTCIFTILCACRVVVGHAKKERERRERLWKIHTQELDRKFTRLDTYARRDILAITR